MDKLKQKERAGNARPGLFPLFGFFVFSVFLLCSSPVVQAEGIGDLRATFTHTARNEPLTAVLSGFAVNQGYSASFTQAVQGTVNGDFAEVTPTAFLADMRAGFGVEVYTLGKTIYFYNQSERRREVLRITSMQPTEMRTVLLRMGALSIDLPSDASNKDNLLYLEGPDNYVSGVVSSIQALESAQLGEQTIRVFKLKHAWADDTSIEGASSSVLLPGVASVLRAIATGQPNPTVRTMHRSDSGSPLMGTGLAGRRATNAPPVDAAAQESSGQANIIAEPRTNSVIVTDKLHKMPYYEAVIAQLDKPADLVEIHAAIVDINANYAQDLGINWGGTRTSGDFAGTTLTGGAPSSSLGDPVNSGFTMTTMVSSRLNQFFSDIRLLEEQGNGAVLARPSVLTTDNVQASLEYTTTFYIKLEGYESVDLVPVTSGTTLKVTPRILRGPDGTPTRLAMSIIITDGSDPVQSDHSTWVGDIPPVKKVTINTQARVIEGQSLLLGGFYYEQRTESAAGIPGVMNIPVAGNLFKRDSRNVQRIERLILISPRIIAYDATDPALPERLSEQQFGMEPTRADYQLNHDFRDLKPQGSGCSMFARPSRSEEPEEQHAAREMPPARTPLPPTAATRENPAPPAPRPAAQAAPAPRPAAPATQAAPALSPIPLAPQPASASRTSAPATQATSAPRTSAPAARTTSAKQAEPAAQAGRPAIPTRQATDPVTPAKRTSPAKKAQATPE